MGCPLSASTRPSARTRPLPEASQPLVSGCAVAARHRLPGITVVGVEPEAGDDTRQSLARGEIVAIPVPQTIA
ncbi:MAG: hypothetical protein JNL87_03035, partial [Burkholderiaceae bacterium]|nr:hypothetical protein [Burkholderiaceae bacterium]